MFSNVLLGMTNTSYADETNFVVPLSDDGGVEASYDDSTKTLTISGSGQVKMSEWSNMMQEMYSYVHFDAHDADWLPNTSELTMNFDADPKEIHLCGYEQNEGINYYLFRFFKGEINLNDAVDVPDVTSMNQFFSETENVKGDVSDWDTSSVTDMYSMFRGSKNVSLDISNWDTSNVTTMDSMFENSDIKNISLLNRGAAEDTAADKIFDGTSCDTYQFKGLQSFTWSFPDNYEVNNITEGVTELVERDTEYTFLANNEYHLTRIGYVPPVVKYTVVFKDYDGTVLKTEEIEEGMSAVAPTDPSREGYTFTGWDKELDNVTSDLEVKAVYDIKTYVVKFLDMDGVQFVETQMVKYGHSAVAPKPRTVDGYTFKKWDKDFDYITSNLEVTAIYDINKYTVKFLDKDGNQIGEAQEVAYGESAVAPEAPVIKGYIFKGWDKQFDPVRSDLEVKAEYDRDFSVTLDFSIPLTEDGAVIATYEDDTKTLTISGNGEITMDDWQHLFGKMTSYKGITNQGYFWKDNTRELTINFVSENKGIHLCGTEVTYSNPHNYYSHVFKDFKGEINFNDAVDVPTAEYMMVYFAGTENIKGDISKWDTSKVTDMGAMFANTKNLNVDISNWDTSNVTNMNSMFENSDIKNISLLNRGEAKDTRSNKIFDGTSCDTYQFKGLKSFTWTLPDNYEVKNITKGTTENVISGTEYTFLANDEYHLENFIPAVKYTVVFKDHDGTVLKTEEVEEGKSAVAPTDPSREGYHFTVWDKDFSAVTSDLEVTAQYEINKYTVKFLDKDGNQIGEAQEVEHGKSAVKPEAPVVEGYTFTDWDKDFSAVTSDLEVKTVYEINKYTVKFLDKEGKIIGEAQEVEHGKSAVKPEAPVVEGYTFTEWDKDFSVVKSDLDVNAQYVINKYIVKFLDKDGNQIGEAQEVAYGQSAVAPEAPAVEGKNFTAWDKAFNNVTSDLEVMAQYEDKNEASNSSSSGSSSSGSGGSGSSSSGSGGSSSSSSSPLPTKPSKDDKDEKKDKVDKVEIKEIVVPEANFIMDESEAQAIMDKFIDMKEHWSKEYVKKAVQLGLFKGMSEYEFAPEAKTTRAMMFALIHRISGAKAEVKEGDVWYAEALKWIKEKGISDGSNPSEVITREQLIAMLYRYMGTPKLSADLSTFNDSDKVSDYARKAMEWAVKEGIIKGDTNGNLNPQASATRAEVAVVLVKLLKK